MGFISPKVVIFEKRYDTPCMLEHLSEAEGSLRWSNANDAKIEVPVYPGAKTLSFDTTGYAPNDHVQNVTVKVNGKPLNEPFIYDKNHSDRIITTSLPKDAEAATVDFDIPNAVAPVTLGLGKDARKLGVAFKSIEESLPYVKPRNASYLLGQDAAFPFDFMEGFSGAQQTERWTDGKLKHFF